MILKILFSIMTTVQERLYELAEPQAGYFTSAQARAEGISNQELYYLRGRGHIVQVAHGIQRLARFPASLHEDVVVALLWAGPTAVASHETALVVFGVGEAVPQRIHVTVSRAFRGARDGVEVHRSQVASDEITSRDGVRVTNPLRTIADVAQAQPQLAATALSDAIESGLVRRRRAIAAVERYPALVTLLEEVS